MGDSTPGLHDRLLLQQLQLGETNALNAVMRTHAQACYRMAYAVLASHALAEDVVQDVFVYLWDRRDSVQITENLRGYLLRATRTRALNVLRHERSVQRVESAAARDERTSTSENDGVSSVDADELAVLVHETLGTLPARTREIFVLRRQEGMSYADIAKLLEIGEPSIRNRMSQATKALSAAVSRWLGMEDPL